MKISMEKAWERALALLRGNTELLAVLAGLFFFLPGFAGVFFVKQPQVAQGMSAEQTLALLEAYALSILPYMLVVTAIGAAGRLAMMVLFTDRSRPTVGEALKRSIALVVPYLLVWLIVGMVIGILAVLLVDAPARAGAPVVPAITFPLLVALAFYAAIKISLAAAVIVAERNPNPIGVIRRSWRLTKGNSLRLLAFYALLFVPYMVIALLAQGMFGAIGAIVGGAEGQLFVGGAAGALVSAAWGALSTAIIAALYEQLSGRSDIDTARTFE
jgi:hypothetical protein